MNPERSPRSVTVLGAALVVALFIPLAKPLTGIRELMLLPDVFIYAIAATCIPQIFRRKWNRLSLFALLCFTVFYLISVAELFNPNVPSLRVGLEGFRKTAHTSVAFFVGLMLAARMEPTTRMLRWVLAAACLVALYGVKQAIWWTEFDSRLVGSNAAGHWTAVGFGGRFRATGTLSGPFHLGMLGVQMFCLARVLQMRPRSRFESAATWAAFALGPLAVLASMTRTNYIALAVLGGLALLFTQRSYLSLIRFQLAAIAASMLLVVAVAAANAGAFGSAPHEMVNSFSDDRFLNRFREFNPMLRAIAERPILGYGMGSAGDALDHAFPPPRVHFTSHNLSLKLLLETGIAGLLAFAGMIAAWFAAFYSAFWNRYADPARWREQMMLATLALPVLFNGLAGSAIEAYPVNFLMWFGLGAAVACAPSRETNARIDP